MFDIKEAFRIDLSRRCTIPERLQAKKDELSSAARDTSEENPHDGDSIEEAIGDVPATDIEKIDFLLKLCKQQMAYGQCTVDAERVVVNAAIAMGLPIACVDIGPRCMHASFENITQNFFISTTRDIILCKLQQVSDLASHIAKEGKKTYTKLDLKAATALMEEIIEEPLPYGWLLQDIMFLALCTIAAIGAFFGSYFDMAMALIIAVVVLGVRKLCSRFPMTLGPLELILVTAISGLMTAALYRIFGGFTEVCNIPIVFLSPLLVYLPGSELIYGAYEVLNGSLVVGGARLVCCFVKCMVMASGLTIGWSITGYNLMQDLVQGTGVEASFVPAEKCPPFTRPHNIGPWWMIFGLWNLAMLIPVLVGLVVHPRDLPAQYIITYLSLVVFGALNFANQEDGGLGLNEFLCNIIGLFVASNLACFREYFTGKVATPSIIPVLLILAPGSVVVLRILLLMQMSGGVTNISTYNTETVSYLWLLGVTYSLGMYIAQSYWRPIILRKQVSSSILSWVENVRKTNVLKDKMI